MSQFTYGTLVVSEIHIPEARGPWMVLAQLAPNREGTEYLVCISLDGRCSVNIPADKVKVFPVIPEIWKQVRV